MQKIVDFKKNEIKSQAGLYHTLPPTWPVTATNRGRPYLALDTPARGRGEAVLKRRPPSWAPLTTTPPSPLPSFVRRQQASPPCLLILLLIMIGAGSRVLASGGRGSMAAATPRRGRPAATLLLLPRHAQPQQPPARAVVLPSPVRGERERESVLEKTSGWDVEETLASANRVCSTRSL